MLTFVAVLIIAGSMGLFTAFFPYPSHASCSVKWEFGEVCPSVEDRLVTQIKEWSHKDCTAKQRCGYEFLGRDTDVIRGTHTTPFLSFRDSFNFTFATSKNGCTVQGNSYSEAWYAVIDFGVNYCNLKNLVMGAQLDEQDPYYTETSNNTVCTMYSLAHCNLYT
ncbi:hypothetical protein HAZT_HAZT006372 [Hyalella azteca]|uniref:Uncharacterized protein n=1 Tax=Hyalella azteca TaxID=294128 RepID=A0A6A0H666_HYAAZ|nr:hypothetical protein HAZT_HAZT006372 [Hyalella azteca]